MRTRTTILGIAIAAVAFAGCSSTGGASGSAAAAGGKLDGKIWVLDTIEANGTRTAVPAGVTVDAEFDAAKSTVAGSAGCNRYTGPYTVSGSSLTFGTLATTMMACVGPAADIEKSYLANLALVKTFTATEDSLSLNDASGASILAYSAAAAATLEGVTWHATGINNGNNGVESVAAGTDPTAVFDKAGTVSGNAGCNTYNGPVVVNGTNVKIGPLVSTKMACADDAANTQEQNFLAALQNATVFEAWTGHLELRDASGALQVSFATR